MAYTQAQNRASQKYQRENLEILSIRVKKGERDIINEYAKNNRTSTAQLIIAAVNEYAGQQLLTPSNVSQRG